MATLKQLSEASPMKDKASLHRQLAALQEDLQAKQAQISSQRKDLEYRQHLLQFAAGLQPCRCMLKSAITMCLCSLQLRANLCAVDSIDGCKSPSRIYRWQKNC